MYKCKQKMYLLCTARLCIMGHTILRRAVDILPVSEKRRAANDKWDAKNIKHVSLAIRKELYERMKAHVQKTEQKTNRFITEAIKEKLEKDDV